MERLFLFFKIKEKINVISNSLKNSNYKAPLVHEKVADFFSDSGFLSQGK